MSVVAAVPDGLWQDFLAAQPLACAKLISLVENRPDLVPDLRDALAPLQRGGVRVAITGPPGVGKSTISASLASLLADAGHRVGVIAVDPSSPFSGGAFLGDRVRMSSLVGDPRIFVRSLASRSGHGGLSPATPDVADVLDAFGSDRILIETVGVGQAEIDVIAEADITVLVLQPGAGDVIQALKAGLVEAADLILVNKSDLPGLSTLLDSLRFTFEIGAHSHTRPAPPILSACATRGEGLDALAEGVEGLIAAYVQGGGQERKRAQRLEREIRQRLKDGLWDEFSKLTDADAAIRAAAEALSASGKSPYPFIRELRSRIRMKSDCTQ